MFSPVELDLERGWPGRIDGDTVVQLAAQTLQSFFTGGGSAREHATYPLADVVFRAPVLHPPSVRIFEGEDFRFANPAAVVAADADVPVAGAVPVHRQAAVIGLDGAIGGFTPLVEWTAPNLPGEKSRDFALALGPLLTTPDEETPAGVDWERLVAHAAANTRLYPGDIIAA
ncbi:MAG TPA: hypothetical protein VHD91_04940 [Gaiellaceae bacterium]|nr:hypothetical protein [Gaiellaceae bacterium]